MFKDVKTLLVRFFTSLELTVVLLVMSIILVFVATLDQVNLGIWEVQQKYFHSFFVMWRPAGGGFGIPIFPGGYLIGGLLFVNLVAAHVYRFKFQWRRAGIIIAHAGLIVLLVGELLTGLWQHEYQMQLAPGETKSYAESFRRYELAIIDTTDPKVDHVIAIPDSMLAKDKPIQVPSLPFEIVPRALYPNAVLRMRTAADKDQPSLATVGIGPQVFAAPAPVTYKPDERNLPAAFVELIGPDHSLGTYLVSPQLGMPQQFSYAGHDYTIAYRIERRYMPFSLTLNSLHHDVYPGSDIPKNFSSIVRLRSNDGKEDRIVRIYMNNPLRYGGLTFYQYQMNSAGTGFSVLQVVKNPSWLMPYISCLMLAFGLLIHFLIMLFGFVRKRRPAVAKA